MALTPEDSPGLLLWQATLAWQRRIAVSLAPFDLTHVQFVLLAVTWWANTHGETPTQAEAAGRAGADVKMTSQVLRTLERKGLLTRQVDTADTRARRLQVTEAGAALAPRAVAAVEAADAAFFSVVDGPHALGLLRALAAPRRAPEG
ncbi:MarR family winged helix-turn-helix transcriptional regulator [Modestobacter sp. NPDC049651]|uniref:MarR family winged helix-turn-helix transcriptional regulator n=1 Tax=unclassified Modestobacter TaxID=2643866 RepID=UPI00340B8010